MNSHHTRIGFFSINIKQFIKKELSSSTFLIGVLVILLLMVILVISLGTSDDVAQKTYYQVKPQSFSVTILTRGEVRPAEVFPIQSEISGNKSKLIWLQLEGQLIKKGEVVARFDKLKYREEKDLIEQRLSDAKAKELAAQKAWILQQEEEAKKLESAEKSKEIARLKSIDLLEGTGKLRLRKLKMYVEQYKREFDIANAELKDYDMMLEKGHISNREREKARDRLRKSEESTNIGIQELQNFEKYEWPRLIREAEILLELAESDFLRIVRISALELDRRRGNIIKAKRDVAKLELSLRKSLAAILQCDITAPTSGILLYKQLPRPEGRRKIQVGDAIWSGQTFLEIPNTENLILEAYVREYDIAKLSEKMSTEIILDAFPYSPLSGHIQIVEKLAVQDKAQGDISLFRVVIALDETHKDIHVGMSARASIVTASVKDKLSVPIQSIEYSNGDAFVRSGDSDNALIPVNIGEVNTEWAEIKKGLIEGDTILVSLHSLSINQR